MSEFIDFVLDAQVKPELAKEFTRLLDIGIASDLSNFFINEANKFGASRNYNIQLSESQKISTAYNKAKSNISANIGDQIGPMAY